MKERALEQLRGELVRARRSLEHLQVHVRNAERNIVDAGRGIVVQPGETQSLVHAAADLGLSLSRITALQFVLEER